MDIDTIITIHSEDIIIAISNLLRDRGWKIGDVINQSDITSIQVRAEILKN
jgi:hypothetical protein